MLLSSNVLQTVAIIYTKHCTEPINEKEYVTNDIVTSCYCLIQIEGRSLETTNIVCVRQSSTEVSYELGLCVFAVCILIAIRKTSRLIL